MPERPFPMK